MLQLSKQQKIQLTTQFLARDPVNLAALKRNESPFLSEDGLCLLLADLQERKQNDPSYDVQNTFLTWDQKNTEAKDEPYVFTQLAQRLKCIGLLKPNENAKFNCGMDFPPAHQGLPQGLGHNVSFYMRNVNGVLKVFISDPSRGLTFKDSSSRGILYAIRQYALNCQMPYKIIISSTTLQKDHHRCTIYGLLATRFYMKHGHELFNEIDNPESQFPYNGTFADSTDENIVFLKADKLPTLLLKHGQYKTLQEYKAFHQKKILMIRNIYQQPADDIEIIAGTHYQSPDIFAIEPENARQDVIVSNNSRHKSDKARLSLHAYRTKYKRDIYDGHTGQLKKAGAFSSVAEKEKTFLDRLLNYMNKHGLIHQVDGQPAIIEEKLQKQIIDLKASVAHVRGAKHRNLGLF